MQLGNSRAVYPQLTARPEAHSRPTDPVTLHHPGLLRYSRLHLKGWCTEQLKEAAAFRAAYEGADRCGRGDGDNLKKQGEAVISRAPYLKG
jgi:hypothetical protein